MLKIFIYITYNIYNTIHTYVPKQMEYPGHMGLKITKNKFGLGHMGTSEIQNYPVENNLILSDQQKSGPPGSAPLIS